MIIRISLQTLSSNSCIYSLGHGHGTRFKPMEESCSSLGVLCEIRGKKRFYREFDILHII
jgi:hypothetical protein